MQIRFFWQERKVLLILEKIKNVARTIRNSRLLCDQPRCFDKKEQRILSSDVILASPDRNRSTRISTERCQDHRLVEFFQRVNFFCKSNRTQKDHFVNISNLYVSISFNLPYVHNILLLTAAQVYVGKKQFQIIPNILWLVSLKIFGYSTSYSHFSCCWLKLLPIVHITTGRISLPLASKW